MRIGRARAWFSERLKLETSTECWKWFRRGTTFSKKKSLSRAAAAKLRGYLSRPRHAPLGRSKQPARRRVAYTLMGLSRCVIASAVQPCIWNRFFRVYAKILKCPFVVPVFLIKFCFIAVSAPSPPSAGLTLSTPCPWHFASAHQTYLIVTFTRISQLPFLSSDVTYTCVRNCK